MENDDTPHWPTVINDCLRLGRMSNGELASRIGLTNSSLSDIKHGRTKEPSGPTRKALMALHLRLERGKVKEKQGGQQ